MFFLKRFKIVKVFHTRIVYCYDRGNFQRAILWTDQKQIAFSNVFEKMSEIKSKKKLGCECFDKFEWIRFNFWARKHF